MAGMNILAKAIYDNIAESGDELEFHRGDVVTVIEQNTAGLEGWWLCSFHGKQGIAPGNRLKILPGMNESVPIPAEQDVYDVPPSHQWNSPQRQIFDDQDEYDIPRRQPQLTGVGFMPQSPNEIYDIPRALHQHQDNDEGEIYDIPPSAIPLHAGMIHPDDDQVYNVPSSLMMNRKTPDPMDVYDVPPLVSRGPQQNDFNPEEVYDVPPRRPELSSTELINVQNPEEVYDVPPSIARGGPKFYMSGAHASPNRQDSTDSDVVYDIPQTNRMAGRRNIPSGLNSLRRMRREINALSTASASDATQQQNLPPAQVDYIYDVPPQVSRDSNQNSRRTNADDVVDGLLKRLSMNNDVDDKKSHRLSTISKDSYSSYIDDNPMQYSKLKVDLNTALEQLIELKQNLEDTVSKLLTMVKRNWRKKENIAGKIHDVKSNFLDVLVAVNQFLIFARGATANAFDSEHSDEPSVPKNVQTGLRKLLVPVEEDAEMLKRALSELDSLEWDIDKLALEDGTDDEVTLDEVDSFVMSSRAVSDDAAQMAVFVHTHAQHIFRKTTELQQKPLKNVSATTSPEKERPAHEIHALQARPLPSVPNANVVVSMPVATTVMPGEDAWLEDYDYVALEDKDDQANENADSLSGLNKRRTQLLALNKETLPTITKSQTIKLSLKEKNALNSLEVDVTELMQALSKSIEQFTTAVEKGNHPHTFVALSKQVILSAHKLVFVGDCMHQRLDMPAVKDMLHRHCSDMCSTLKHTVVSTKLAALQWPAVSAVQDMVDKMYDIAKCAHQFRLTLNDILY